MYSRFYSYLSAKYVLCHYQFGLRANHSTSLALIYLLDEIYDIDNRDNIIGVYVDLQKAFDTTDHNILLFKMNRICIRGIFYEWFKDYLTNRRQYVTADGLNSDINSIKCGVPQGNVLGPLLFFCYTWMTL